MNLLHRDEEGFPIVLSLCFFFAHVVCEVDVWAVAGETPPNVVFILTDDMGWGDSGVYGHPYIRTPAIDQLAAGGTRFTQFYVTSSVCSPSRAGFMTGRFSSNLGIHDLFIPPGNYLDPELPTVTELFDQAGYATAHVGKWHLGQERDANIPEPGAYGIDLYRTFVSSARAGNDIKWLGLNDLAYSNNYTFEEKSATVIFGEATRFIEEHKHEPFYLQVWTRIPHAPVDSTPEQIAAYDDLTNLSPEAFSQRMAEYASAAEDFDGQLRNYMASMTYLDSQIGLLLDCLDANDLSENTIIVFSSDNGPEKYQISNVSDAGMGYPGIHREGKRSLYDGGLRVPLIVRWPGRVPANEVNSTSVISSADYLPTICAAAGVSIPSHIILDGENMLDVLIGDSPRSRSGPLFWHLVGFQDPVLAMRDGDLKVLVHSDGMVELFDMIHDPGEHASLVLHESFFPTAQLMTDRLMDWFYDEMPGRRHPDIEPQIFISEVVPLSPALPWLEYAIYTGTGWTQMPDFASILPATTGAIGEVDISLIAPRPNDFGCVFRGYIHITDPGIYDVELASDDASALYLSEHLLLANEGVAGVNAQKNEVYLQEGAHPVRLEYFQQEGDAFLDVRWRPSGGGEEDVLSNNYFTTIPGAVSDKYAVEQGSTRSVFLPEEVVTANDVGAISAGLDRDVSHGVLEFYSNGSFSYTPDIGFSGLDYFTYRASSWGATGSAARVVLRVAPVSRPGHVPRYYWSDVPGPLVSDLTSNERYPDQPDGAGFLDQLLATDWKEPFGDNNFGDNYGQLIEGFIDAPETGNYTFWVAADQGSEFWLSHNSGIAGAARIAFHYLTTEPEGWGRYSSQKSDPIPLEEGSWYYFRWLHKEGETTVNDYARVGWARPGEPTDTPSEVIPGSVLYPYFRSPDTAFIAEVSAVTDIQAISFSSVADRIYFLQSKPSVAPHWNDTGASIVGTGGVEHLYDPAGFSTQNTYRVLGF